MGIMVYALLWVMQDLYHQPYESHGGKSRLGEVTSDLTGLTSSSWSRSCQSLSCLSLAWMHRGTDRVLQTRDVGVFGLCTWSLRGCSGAASPGISFGILRAAEELLLELPTNQ